MYQSAHLNLFCDEIKVQEGYILFVLQKDEHLQGNLRKAPKIIYKGTQT